MAVRTPRSRAEDAIWRALNDKARKQIEAKAGRIRDPVARGDLVDEVIMRLGQLLSARVTTEAEAAAVLAALDQGGLETAVPILLGGRPLAWEIHNLVRTSMRRLWRELNRRAHAANDNDAEEPTPQPTVPAPHEALVERETEIEQHEAVRGAIADTLGGLCEDDIFDARDVAVILQRLERVPDSDIAQNIGVSESYVRVLQHRALKKPQFKRRLAQHLPEEWFRGLPENDLYQLEEQIGFPIRVGRWTKRLGLRLIASIGNWCRR